MSVRWPPDLRCNMRRRDFIAMLGAMMTRPARAQSQQSGRVSRVGLLSGIAESDPEAQAMVAGLNQALQEAGWVIDHDLQIERRWGGGDTARIDAYARELVGMHPDVLIAYTTPTLLALHRETGTIPIVFVQISDPIGAGFVADLAHPGGNITGFTNYEASMVSKWAELIKAMAPDISRIAFLFNPETAPYVGRFYQAPLEAAARSFGMQPSASPVHGVDDIASAIAALGREPRGGLILMPDASNILHRDRIVTLAAQYRVPLIAPYRFVALEGGLIAYGVDQVELFRRAGVYVDRILKGAKPSDLPVQAPTKFQLVVNLKTAKTLGLDVPVKILAAADEVIE
jgi:putative tryptophan/tyrosine transport system substrate-binding protein